MKQLMIIILSVFAFSTAHASFDKIDLGEFQGLTMTNKWKHVQEAYDYIDDQAIHKEIKDEIYAELGVTKKAHALDKIEELKDGKFAAEQDLENIYHYLQVEDYQSAIDAIQSIKSIKSKILSAITKLANGPKPTFVNDWKITSLSIESVLSGGEWTINDVVVSNSTAPEMTSEVIDSLNLNDIRHDDNDHVAYIVKNVEKILNIYGTAIHPSDRATIMFYVEAAATVALREGNKDGAKAGVEFVFNSDMIKEMLDEALLIGAQKGNDISFKWHTQDGWIEGVKDAKEVAKNVN